MPVPPSVDMRPTLLYCRESRDEDGANYERIEVQREMLLRFCRRKGLVNIVDIVMDDDVSGTGFARFAPILERVRRKEIQVLVFKDGSRLGRNLKESLIFAETVERCGAQILFESEEYDEDFFPLRQWFNEQRAKEDSRKIRSVLRHKMETGTLLVRPPYGYRRGEDGAMLPDEQSAEIVRWIFRQALSGEGNAAIAAELNRLNVQTPSQTLGANNAAQAWVAQHIRRILTNPVYTGTMIHNRSVRKSYKNRQTVMLPREEWIILEGHHPPLISEEQFLQIQRMRQTEPRTGGAPQERPFSGLLRCGRCGRSLVRRTRKGRPNAYLCAKNHVEGAPKDEIRPGYGCRPHRVRESLLETLVRERLQELLGSVKFDEHALAQEALRCMPERDEFLRLQKNLERVQHTIHRIYDDRLSNLISEELFTQKYREQSRLADTLRERIETLEKLFARERAEDCGRSSLLEEAAHATLTGKLLRILFRRIIVYEKGEIGEREREELGMSQEQFALLSKNGGIVFVQTWRD